MMLESNNKSVPVPGHDMASVMSVLVSVHTGLARRAVVTTITCVQAGLSELADLPLSDLQFSHKGSLLVFGNTTTPTTTNYTTLHITEGDNMCSFTHINVSTNLLINK